MAVQPETTHAEVFQVDREHGSVRLVSLLIFFASWAIIALILLALISSSGLNLIAILGGFLGGYLVTNAAERVLRDRWISGKTLTVDRDGIRVTNKGTVTVAVRADEAVELLQWRFRVARRARIPKGWWMLALGMESDNSMIAAYTFMPPADTEAYVATQNFTVLEGKSSKAKQPEASSLRAAGEERRLRAAEEVRWMGGIELTADDFRRLVELAQSQFPEWAPIR